MIMPNRRLIQKKLSEILKQLKHLQKLVHLDEAALFGKAENYYFAERVMERLIGAAIDINMHIAADATDEIPENYYDSFLILSKIKIFPQAFAKKIAPSTSLRNILVHEYQKIDSKKFQQALRHGLKDYTEYAEYLQKYLKKV